MTNKSSISAYAYWEGREDDVNQEQDSGFTGILNVSVHNTQLLRTIKYSDLWNTVFSLSRC